MKAKKGKTRQSKPTKRNRTVIKKAQRVVVLNRAKGAKRNPKTSKSKKALRRTGKALKGAARSLLSAGSEILGAGAGALNPRKPRRRNKAARVTESDISKFPPHVQRQLRAQLGQLEQREVKARTPAQKKAVAKSRRSFLARLGTRLKVIGQTKKIKVSARDLGRCPRKKIKVRARHETDALAKAQSKLGRGFDQFKVGNPRKAKKRSVTARSRRKPGRSRQKRNPQVLALVNRTSPKARANRREFAGEYRRDTPLYFPEGTPSGLSKLGKLLKVETERATVTPTGNDVWLCRDMQGRLYVGTRRKDSVIYSGPAENFGRVKRVDYEDVKKHLGYNSLQGFYHFMGEEDGKQPTLHADGKGGLKFRGKYHKITPEGIVN